MRSPLLAAALLLLLLPSPRARAADLPAGLEGLEKDAEAWFLKAGDPNAPAADRNACRRKCWASLARALAILDGHADRNPGDRDRIHDRRLRAGAMAYWVRRESPLGLLEDPGAVPAGAPGSGPGGSRNPFDQPAPGSAAPLTAGPPPGTLELAVAAVEGWEKERRSDLAGAMARWHEAMARFPDRWSHPAWQKAAERGAAARRGLEDWYRRVRDADPGSLPAPESPEVTRLLVVLGREVQAQSSAEREKAARLLALLGAPDAVVPLDRAVRREEEPQARLAMGESIADLGGARGSRALGALRSEAALAPLALDWLVRMAGRNAVDRRFALREIGGLALAEDEAVAGRAVDLLVAAGPAGARGLEEALATPGTETRLKVMRAIAATMDPRTARPLSNFLLTSAESPGTEECRRAAWEAIKAMGEPTVPYLFPALRNPRTRLCTGDLLREITGAAIGSGRVDDWIEWWKKKHPEWKE